jgi:hypothetical protein
MTAANFFYGWNHHGGKAESVDDWREDMLVALRHGISQQFSLTDVPGYNFNNAPGQKITAGFVNVPKLATTIFNYRTKQGQFAGGTS